MNKAYNRINWENYPSTDTPLNETNLNHMDLAVDTIDDRVITLDTTKADEADLLTCVASISFNSTTGIMTITLKNGTQGTIDTGLSKLAINFDYDDDPTSPHYQQIILEMADGTYKYTFETGVLEKISDEDLWYFAVLDERTWFAETTFGFLKKIKLLGE